MHTLTIGQVLLLFDGMTSYVVLTNPFGSGDATGSRSSGEESAPSTRTAVWESTQSGILHPQGHARIDQIDPSIRDALLDPTFQDRR